MFVCCVRDGRGGAVVGGDMKSPGIQFLPLAVQREIRLLGSKGCRLKLHPLAHTVG